MTYLSKNLRLRLGCMTLMGLSPVGDHKEDHFFFLTKITFKCDNNILINRKFQN